MEYNLYRHYVKIDTTTSLSHYPVIFLNKRFLFAAIAELEAATRNLLKFSKLQKREAKGATYIDVKILLIAKV